MSLLNYTTGKDPDITVGEIAKMLSMAGASAVMTEYDRENGNVSALAFRMMLNDREISFRLPCDWRPVLSILENDPKARRQGKVDRPRAVRVAWRIVKDWIEAQLALISTQMVKTEQVFLPYAVMKDGRTLFENVADGKFLLGDGSSE